MSTGIKKDGTLYICSTPQPADLLQAGFEGLTWVEIGNVVTMPGFGVTDNIKVQDYINAPLSQQSKGFKKASDASVVVGSLQTDPGQVELRAAAATKYNYALKLEQSDAPDSAHTNTIRYSRGVIGGPDFPGGGGEDYDNETFQIALNQIPIVVPSELI